MTFSVFLVTFISDGTPRQIFNTKAKARKFCNTHDDAEWEEWEVSKNDT